jgi:hypothetical protein
VKRLLQPVCAHRVVVRAKVGERRGEQASAILAEIAASVPTPDGR